MAANLFRTETRHEPNDECAHDRHQDNPDSKVVSLWCCGYIQQAMVKSKVRNDCDQPKQAISDECAKRSDGNCQSRQK